MFLLTPILKAKQIVIKIHFSDKNLLVIDREKVYPVTSFYEMLRMCVYASSAKVSFLLKKLEIYCGGFFRSETNNFDYD